MSSNPDEATKITEAATSPPAKRIKTNMDATTATPAPPPLQVKKLSEKGRLPTRGSAFAAGYDIYAARDTVVPARGKVLVDTDISIAVPAETCTLNKAGPQPFRKKKKKRTSHTFPS